MNVITTAHELEEVRALPRAFVFIYVNWSEQARLAEITFSDFLAEWGSLEPDHSIPVYRVDLSDQDGEIWDSVRKWLKKEIRNETSFTYGGYGALLWVRSGTVVASVPAVVKIERAKLVALTQQHFLTAA